MDLTKYPMDKQTCTLQLESWGYNINDVMFYWTRGNESVSGLDTLQLAQYTVEDHYTSVSEAVYETGSYPKLVFHFELKRSILYFILETYVPSSLLVVLSWVSFWISLSSVPARICIGVTTVLTMTTLMMGARTSLPNANCFIKAIDVYLGICFSFIFGALIEYAVAHFCSLSHADAHMFMYSHQMQEMEDEINGIVTTITSHSHRAKRRKEPAGTTPPAHASTQLTVSPSSPSGSEPKPEASPPEPTNLCLTTLATFRKIFRLISCCHVENPHHIDNYSRVAFPLSFVGVNLLYWTYYLYL
uniref:Gamma-aminobutyric acid (GABA) A receptor, pi n=2 Tax=Nothobranchius furzeri TaxID=105023 RepID=A0A1A8V8W6_NOTFU